MHRQLLSEVDGLRNAGAAVHVIQPDAASLVAFGPNLMDPAGRAAAAQAGVRQGLSGAEELRQGWSDPAPRDG